jgi:putative nucleotidyltransferase with HDIG domain
MTTETAVPPREDAWHLLCEYTQGEQLRKHALGVEAVMRHFARRAGESEDLWGLVGLLHDFDYERYPDPPDHPLKGAEVLAARRYPEVLIRAIKCHAPYLGLSRDTLLEKTIFAVDELTGFVVAVALVRPNGLDGLESRSVMKKFKDRRFAAGVIREDVLLGAEELGTPLPEIIDEVIRALQDAEAKLREQGRTLLAA